MTNEPIFVRIRTMPWEECESCHRSNPQMFQLWEDRNGAISCFDCASEFGWIAGIDVPHPSTIGRNA